jgi:hypothetical protein
VSRGANPSVIAIDISGALKLKLNKNGDLLLGAQGGRFQEPQVYQQLRGGTRKAIEGHYRIISANTVGFCVGDL